jgi:hypothetical protein
VHARVDLDLATAEEVDHRGGTGGANGQQEEKRELAVTEDRGHTGLYRRLRPGS